MNESRWALVGVLSMVLMQGCRCERGTWFMNMRYEDVLPDRLLLTLQQESPLLTKQYDLVPTSNRREDSLRIRFLNGYPAGATFLVTIDGFDTTGTRVSHAMGRTTCSSRCTFSEETLRPEQASDGGVSFQITHVPQHYLTDATCDLDIPSAVHRFDTTTGLLDNLPIPTDCVFQSEQNIGDGGNPFFIQVLAVRSLRIASGATLRVTGQYPLTIVAGTTVQIDGILDGSATLNAAGPGGLGIGRGVGDVGISGPNSTDSGGAGGSYGTRGADGADGVNGVSIVTGGPQGAFYNEPSLPVSVEAGSAGTFGGGASPVASPPCGLGGGGGGAIQLSAGQMLAVNGSIRINGGGGLGGCNEGNEGRGGGGGGSGGGLYLESPIITLGNSATLTANGGGGGSGGSEGTPAQRGNDGQNGLPLADIAQGGAAVGSGGPGGNGAAGAIPPITGATTGASTFINGGGGGGGVGRIAVRAQIPPSTTAIISPPPTFVPITALAPPLISKTPFGSVAF